MLLGELLAERSLQPVLTKVQDQVRREPANPKHRIFLFQLLSILGQWERALTQLNVLEEMDAGSVPMAQTYREALRCEMLRADVFAGRRSPLIFGDPEPWIALLLEALRLTAEGHHEQAAPVREQAFEGAPMTAGVIDNQSFSWIADADSRLGPVLEAIINGRYFWIPIHRIGSVKLEAPTDLRDLVWMPALFTWSNGGEVVGLIPTRYPGSSDSPDPALQLAHK
ncbi:MAG: virulence protein SciE type, partial [Candidatus Competibacteraceae bacterium]|nr:virulence protein SciE type [Candidatus Competibacteraceae bacterium]